MKFIKLFLAGLLAFVVGSFVMLFLWIFILIGIAGSVESTVTVKPNSILKIDLSESIVDAPASDPFAGLDLRTMQVERSITLYQALTALDAAKNDSRIKGIYLRTTSGDRVYGAGGISLAGLEELREAVEDFKTSGKFVVAYNEAYGQGGYYLASAADRIFLEPNGGLMWSGLPWGTMFYKGLFDKLGIKAEVFRPTACKYKSAVEPFILDKMSDANRRQMQQVVNSLWGTIAESVSQSRGIPVAELNRLADDLEVTLPEEALRHRFVDSLVYEDYMKEVFASYGVEAESDGNYAMVTLGTYASQLKADLKNVSSAQVAIVYADGAIVDGEGSGKEVFGNTLAGKLAKVRRNDKVKAVVLRVNSPGGSALASDVIWREMELLKAEKPVIVSMGAYAASGGYYISCPADVIVADRTTLTGSIGVYGMFFDIAGALKDKLGITFDAVKSNASADMGMMRPLTPLERSSIMRGVDKVYTTFTNNVAAGRNLPLTKVLEIAQGRVWSGADALGIGLIDSYGGLNAAIGIAANKAGLGDDYRITEITEGPVGFAALLQLLNAKVRTSFTRSELGDAMRMYERIQEVASQQGVVMYCPYRLDIDK